jgi:hypothetical protein
LPINKKNEKNGKKIKKKTFKSIMEYNTEKFYRSYSVTTEDDFQHISNGRCPNYALSWEEHNKIYWESGHDYILGNNYDNEEDCELFTIRKLFKMENKPKIYIDLNVLVVVDFECFTPLNMSQVMNGQQLPINELKGNSNRCIHFSKEGIKLWNEIQQLKPIILTECLQSQTINWCKLNLGPDIQVISCNNNYKPYYCDEPHAVLIDDQPTIEKSWEEAGGVFIHHTNAKQTLIHFIHFLEKSGAKIPSEMEQKYLVKWSKNT